MATLVVATVMVILIVFITCAYYVNFAVLLVKAVFKRWPKS